MLLMQFTTAVEVHVNMHWRLRSQAGALCKSDTLSVSIAILGGGSWQVLFVKLHPQTNIRADMRHSGQRLSLLRILTLEKRLTLT